MGFLTLELQKQYQILEKNVKQIIFNYFHILWELGNQLFQGPKPLKPLFFLLLITIHINSIL